MNRFILLAVFCSPATLGLELGVGLMKELLSFPLKNNPFFAAVVALSGNFNTDGIIDDTVDSSGYACQMLGDFKCQEDFPKCSGMGYIDCTDDCPGTEEEFKFFQTMMDDDKIKEKFPLISAKIKPNDKKKNDDKMETMEVQDQMNEDPKIMFLKSLQSCSNFSQSTLALLNMAAGSDNGMQFGANSEDPNDLTYVAPNAVSNISLIEYDYSDYYDDIEESSKIRRDASNEESSVMEVTVEKVDKNNAVKVISVKQKNEKDEKIHTKEKYEEMLDCKSKKCQKDYSLAKKKQDYIEKTNGMEDYKELSEIDRENMNMIRSVEDDQELSDTNLTALEEKETSHTHLVKREIEEFRKLFYSTLMRNRRSTTSMMEMKDYCIVRNMTCLEFPTKSQCSGFGVGRCGTMRDMLVKLFTPHVVMVSVVSIIVIVMVTVGLSYYCYKLKSENRVEPSEQVE